jgi:tetratricopeptide (TPR) repeat protein
MLQANLSRRVMLQGAVIASAFLAACQPVQKPAATMPATIDPGTAPVIGNEPTAGGIYLSLGSFEPLTGEALAKARMSRAAILAATKSEPGLATTRPASQPATQAKAATTQNSGLRTQDSSEPPPLAVKYYLQGREKFLEGANSQAMDYLDKALALDPNAFTVLRLMGRVCFASSQLARGSLFLQRAYAIDPNDVEVNYLLGRYWLERKEFPRAVSHLMQAADSPERRISSAQTPLVSFYLSRALQSAGYHKAAAAEYERFLETIKLPVAGYRYDRELNYLIEESWASELSAAENDVLVGDYAAALAHYRVAYHHEPNDPFIISRLTNALVHVNRGGEARETALSLVTETQGSDDSIKLLAWSYKATGRENELLADLRNRAGMSDSAASTLTLAAAQDYLGQSSAAFDTLRAYVEKHPDDLNVLGRLVKRADSTQNFVQIIKTAAAVLARNPDKSAAIVELLTPAAKAPAAATFAKDPAASPAATPYESYLFGILYRALNETERAEKSFRDAALIPGFFPAREALVSSLIAQEKFPEASRMIQDAIAHNQGGAKAYQLLIESEGAQERLASALKIAKEAKEKFPDNAEIRMQLATIYRLREQDEEADAELAALIDAQPKYELAYKALVNSLLTRARDEGRDGSKLQMQAVTYLGRLVREVPGSTYGRITAAILNARDGMEESEIVLRRLVAEHPDDLEALAPLAQIRQALGRPMEAVATLEVPLKLHPTPELAQTLAQLYRVQDKDADALTLTERMMKEHPDNEEYVIVDAGELIAQKRRADALQVLAAASEKFPKSQAIALALAQLQSAMDKPADAVATMKSFIAHAGETAQRLYRLAHFQSAADQEADSERTLQHVIELMPDHTGANNDLGYFWTDAGKNLNQAEKMIRKALDNQPNNAAYLDSLGWVFYKQGKFNEAIPWFEKAIAEPDGMEPEVIQHLGDALYRAGRPGEAAERWLQARTLLSENLLPGATLTKDKQRIKSYLDAALAAVKSGATPELSPIARGFTPKAASTSRAPTAQ